MRPRHAACLACLAAILPACGGEEPETLRVYSSMPAGGPDERYGNAIERGMDRALRKAKGRAGEFEVEHVALDDGPEGWFDQVVADNARRAVQDDEAVAYIGEFHSTASAISMPILNEAPLLQVSPSNTATGLTTGDPGAAPGEPESHYPSGRRHFVRLTPRNSLQAAALVRLMRDRGCRLTTVVEDGSTYGGELAASLRAAAGAGSVALERARPTGNRGDCLVFLGVDREGARAVYDAVAAARPGIRLLGAHALISPPAAVAVGAAAQRRLLVTSPLTAEGYAAYGEEAMALVLDAIERAGKDGDDPAAVVESAFATRDRRSALGTYDVTATGDTTLGTFGVWAPRGDRAVLRGVVHAR